MEENINQFEDSNPIKDHIRVKNEDIIDKGTPKSVPVFMINSFPWGIFSCIILQLYIIGILSSTNINVIR